MSEENRKFEILQFSSDCCEAAQKKVLVEYLYLDLQTCERCIGTGNFLDEIMKTLTPALELAGYTVEYNKVEMENANIAIQHKFLSSPTIRVNGRDICTSIQENNCGCCSDISGTDVDCRLYEYKGKTYEVPPKEMLAEHILCSVFREDSEGCSCENAYQMPENLNSFYEGMRNSGCSC
jgi:hypothetical protein